MRPVIKLLSALAALLLLLGAAGRMKTADCVRLHVIANSDSKADQSVKLKVRDALLDCARENFTASSKADAKRELLSMGGELQEAAEKTLAENGFSYGAELFAGTFEFPDRDYNGEFYPAGSYDALRVVLGDGAGQNWWCVMFPPLCVITTDGEEPEYNEDGTLKFKSFIGDLIKEIFG